MSFLNRIVRGATRGAAREATGGGRRGRTTAPRTGTHSGGTGGLLRSAKRLLRRA